MPDESALGLYLPTAKAGGFPPQTPLLVKNRSASRSRRGGSEGAARKGDGKDDGSCCQSLHERTYAATAALVACRTLSTALI